MLSQYLQELEQEPFDAEEFVERLAWRSASTNNNRAMRHGKKVFQPDVLHMTFTQAIKDLEVLGERSERKCKKLEEEVAEEEQQHWRNVAKLLQNNHMTFSQFQQLDGQMNRVAARVVHLGDQLEAVNTPRARAAEAHTLMMHFSRYLTPPSTDEMEGGGMSLLGDTPKQISESADVIQKLFLISQELPTGKFEEAKARIASQHDKVERELIVQFVSAQRCGDVESMKHLAGVLSQFRGYSQCIDAFIEEMQHGFMRDVFSEVLPLCLSAQTLIEKVFSSPEQVMTKFVINIYQGQLKEHIQSKLSSGTTGESYFINLSGLYTKTQTLNSKLSEFNFDQSLLPQLTKAIFQTHLQAYINSEVRFLKERFSAIISRFYHSKDHKKVQQSSGMKEIKLHLQDVLGATGINTSEAHDGESFLAEDVALSLLDETKSALARCTLLSSSNAVASNAVQIYSLLTHSLIDEFVDYAIDLGHAGIPAGEVKSQPHLSFLSVVQQTSSILHLLHRVLHDTLMPLVISSPEHSGVLQRKRQLVQKIQQRLSGGLERLVTAVCLYTKHLLSTHQKKTDYKPEQDDMSVEGNTVACQAVVRWLTNVTKQIDCTLDGSNLDTVRLELGVRFHRTLMDHLLRFEYNTTGAMCIICDVNEYRKIILPWKQPLVTTLFDTLHTLCKLLQVSPQNLQIVCSGDQLAGLDKTVLANFIQLRADFKTAKLGTHFR